MPRYVAFLRGVSPMNAKMPALKRCFESVGFTEVKTVISSGNVVFDSPMRSVAAIERKAEAAMPAVLGRTFYTIVRPVDELKAMLAADFYAAHGLPPEAKRLVGFLREPPASAVQLPVGNTRGEGGRLGDAVRPPSINGVRPSFVVFYCF